MGILKNLFSKKQETLKPPHKPDYTEVHTEEIARLTEESPIKQEELTPTQPPHKNIHFFRYHTVQFYNVLQILPFPRPLWFRSLSAS